MGRSIGTLILKVGMMSFPISVNSYADYTEQSLNSFCEHGHGVNMKRWCKTCDKEIGYGQLRKGLKIGDTASVLFTKGQIEKIKQKYSDTEIVKVYETKDHDTNLIRTKNYYVSPKLKFEDVYHTIKKALKKAGLSILIKYALRGRQRLGVLEVHGNDLILGQVVYPESLRQAPSIDDKAINPDDIDVAVQFFNQLKTKTATKDFNSMKDNYREEIYDLIKGKAQVPTATAVAQPTNSFAAALKQEVK